MNATNATRRRFRRRRLDGTNITQTNATLSPPVGFDNDNSTNTSASNESTNYFFRDPVNPMLEEHIFVSRDPLDRVKRDFTWFEKIDIEFLGLHYLPFFSNCRGYGKHIYTSKFLESHPAPDCTRASPQNRTGYIDPWPWREKTVPQADECQLPVQKMDKYYPNWEWTTDEFGDPLRLEPAELDKKNYEEHPGTFLSCIYEENIMQPSTKTRWFEAKEGQTLFWLTRRPVKYETFVEDGADWGRGDFLQSLLGTEKLIPVSVDTDGPGQAFAVPQKVNLEIVYFQRDQFRKSIVSARIWFEDLCTFTKNEKLLNWFQYTSDPPVYPCIDGNFDYTLSIRWKPANWLDLMNFFEFGYDLYTAFFIGIGFLTVFIGMVWWVGARLTTRLKHPPSFKFLSFLRIVAPPPFYGVFLSLVPVFFAVILIYVWFITLKSSDPATPEIAAKINFEQVKSDWQDTLILDAERIETNRMGRIGIALVTVGLYFTLLGAKLFVPDSLDIQAGDDVRQDTEENEQDAYADDADEDEVVIPSRFWTPRFWKRSHMIFVSICLEIVLLIIWEFSYSPIFEEWVYEIIIIFKIAQIFMDMILAEMLRENLMVAPLLIAIEVTEIMVTMGASDFMDFVISYFVELSMCILERLFLDPWLKHVSKMMPKWQMQIKRKFEKRRNMTREQRAKEDADWKKINEQIALENEGVEPLLDSYAVYANELEALCMAPFVNIFLVIYFDITQIPSNYSIRETDLKFYVVFALIMVPFTLLMDTFLLNAMELIHKWKLYDYVSYQTYRFSVRETRWQMQSDTLDESISEPLQSVDMMCFSSQYYFMAGIHSWGMLITMWGMTVHLRNDYNFFADRLVGPIMLITVLLCTAGKYLCLKFGDIFKIWALKSLEGTVDDDIAAKLAIGEGRQEDLEAERLELQAMNSERFRHRFLERSRPWVLQHLTELLTPRTLQMPGPDGRPNIEYIRDVYADLMNMGEGRRRPGDRADISSDEEDDQEALRRGWSKAPLSKSSAAIARWWLEKARQRRVLMKLVAGFMQNSTLEMCQLCGRTEASGVKLRADIGLDGKYDPRALDVLMRKYEATYPDKEFDGTLWQSFFRSNAQCITRCSICIDALEQQRVKKTIRHPGKGRVARSGDISSDEEVEDAVFEPMVVSRSSVEGRVMTKWLVAARKRLGGTFPRPDAREQMEEYAKRMRDLKARKGMKKAKTRGERAMDAGSVSFGHVNLNAASTAIISLWMRKAKLSLVQRSNEIAARLRKELSELVGQIHEDDDWYYGAEMRLDGISIQKEGREIYDARKSKEEEARAQKSRVESEFEDISLEMRRVLEAKNVALDKLMQDEETSAMKDADARVRELTKVKQDKASAFKLEEKNASFADRARLAKEHRDQLKALDDAIENEKRKQMKKVEERLGKKRDALRQEIAVKEKQLAAKKRVKDKQLLSIDEAMIKEAKPIERKWQSRSMVWMEKARRKILMKKQEDEAKAKLEASRGKRRK